jgi:uncharacterized protein
MEAEGCTMKNPNPIRISATLALPMKFITETQAILAKKRRGKCLAPETLVLRYDGAVVRADSVKVGDKLMGPDSRPRTVLHCASGRGSMFEIVPVKGDPWRCNSAHVLTLKHTSTGEIIDIPLDEYLAKHATFRFLHMQFMTGVDFAPSETLPLSPYFLGLWFGDGDKARDSPNYEGWQKGRSTRGLRRVAITSMDAEVIEECEAVALQFGLKVKREPKDKAAKKAGNYRIVNDLGAGNPLLDLMRAIVGPDVVVPHQYLTASRSDRLAFLAGWIDSDGHLSYGSFDFVQKRRDWLEAVVFLARSLGFRASIAPKIVNGETFWRTRIRGDIEEVPTRLAHKQAGRVLRFPTIRRGTPVYLDHQRTGVKQVRALGIGPYAGFTLDGDGRFLLGDFTVTHNSYAAQVEAEELLELGQQIVVLDPTGAWWGLRSAADGKSPGYAITIFGGDHGDVPLEPTSGEALATAIVTERFSAVIDLSLLRKGERLRFAADFLETLYRLNKQAMHLFIDEADAFIPQKTFTPEQARCLGAGDELVRRGGIKGIGVTMISQRPQVVNKDVLSQIDMLLVLQMNHPKDLHAIEDWIVDHVNKDTAREMLASLPALPIGHAWVWAPEAKIFQRIEVRQKRTFDSGRTPKAGERLKPPKKLAKVDLERLGKTLSAAVEEAKANDPKSLRARVAELLKDLAAAKKAKEKIIVKEVEIVKPADLRRLEALVKKIDKLILRIAGADANLELHLSGLRMEATKIKEVVNRVTQFHAKKGDAGALVESVLDLAAPPVRPVRPVRAAQSKPLSLPSINDHAVVAAPGGAKDLKPAHLRLLSAIAWWEAIGVPAADLGGVAFVAGTSTKSSAFDNNRSFLRARGYIDYPQTGRVRLTDAGRQITPPPSIPPTKEALHEAVLSKVTPAVGRMLRVLIEAHPNEMSLEEFAKLAGTSTTSSAFDNNRSWLRARGLSDYPRTGFVRATELLFPEAS